MGINSTIKNNKGGILVITLVSMMILTIIGYVALKMFASQNVMDAYDQAKMRTDYCAEGIVERARGYIDYVVEKNVVTDPTFHGGHYGDLGESGQGYLFTVVSQSPANPPNDHQWELFNETAASQPASIHYRVDGDYGAVDRKIPVDDSYPKVYANVYCTFVNSDTDGIKVSDFPSDQIYKLVGVASTTIDVAGGTLVVSTVTCYFRTHNEVQTTYAAFDETSGYAARKFAGSSSDKIFAISPMTTGIMSETPEGEYHTNRRFIIGWRKS